MLKASGQQDEDDVNDEQLSQPAPPPSMAKCKHHLLQVMDFALTSNNSDLLGDVAKCLDTMSRIQHDKAAAAIVYHDTIY